MTEPTPSPEASGVDPAIAARLHRWSLTLRLVMVVNTLVLMAVLGLCLWKVGQLLGAW